MFALGADALIEGGLGVAEAAAPEIAAGTADVAAADAGLALGADSLGGAAAVDAATADAGLGAASLGGAAATDAGIAAADAAGLGGAALADTAAPATSAADALNFAPAAADTTAAGGAGGGGLSAVQAAAAPQSTAIATDAGAATTPAAELSGNPNIAAALDRPESELLNPLTGQGGPTTAEAALAQQTVPAASSAAGGAGGAAADATTAGGSLSSGVNDFLNSPYTKAAELGLPLGFLAYNLIKGPPGLPTEAKAAVDNANANIAPLQAEANQNVPQFNQTAATDLNLATNNQISPQQAASIQIYVQNAQNQLRQQIANQGNQNVEATSEWAQGNQQIQQQALAMQVQMINQLISTAFQAATAANAGVSTGVNAISSLDNTLMQAAQIQVQQDTAFQNSVSSALSSFGMLAALSNLKVTGATTV